MKYAIVKVVNGSYSIAAEGITDEVNAIVQFHNVCMTLWNSPDVVTATVTLVDEKLQTYKWYTDTIEHPVQD